MENMQPRMILFSQVERMKKSYVGILGKIRAEKDVFVLYHCDLLMKRLNVYGLFRVDGMITTERINYMEYPLRLNSALHVS